MITTLSLPIIILFSLQRVDGFLMPRKTVLRSPNEFNQCSGQAAFFPQLRGGGSSVESSTCALLQISPTAASLLAGSLAGAIGVGVAFPLDTLKTKSQVLSQQETPGTVNTQVNKVSEMNMFQLIAYIYDQEGLSGFFGGVKGMMIGQAMIKAVAFATNSFTLNYIRENYVTFSSTAALLLAACMAGFVTSFLVTPIERVKVMMQASNKYRNEFACIRAIIDSEGIGGLLQRGLGPTLGREIPSYGIYFFVYGFLSQTQMAKSLGLLGPLVFGALSGMLCWIPVYPIDVVKTLVQNTDGSDSTSSLDIAKKLYLERGISGFFDGIVPKMLRAAVNHSVTFFCYDIVMGCLTA